MSKFWEVFGDVRKAIFAHGEQRAASMKAMFAFQKEVGGTGIGLRESLGVDLAISFDAPPDPAVWKKVKDSKDQYLPRLSTKAGKEIDKRMRELCKSHPSASRIADLIEMQQFDGGRWRTPGYTIRGKRAFIKTPDDYKPPKKLAAFIKRTSDLEYEKMA